MPVVRCCVAYVELLSCLDRVRIGYVRVSRRGPVPSAPEQFADQEQVLTRHDALAGHGVPQVVQTERAALPVRASRSHVIQENPDAPAFGMAWTQERVRVARTSQGRDELPRRFSEQHCARASLRNIEHDGVAPDLPPAKIKHLAATASGECQQPDPLADRSHLAEAACTPQPPAPHACLIARLNSGSTRGASRSSASS